MSMNLNTKATAAALLVVAGLSWPTQAEMLALRCEGTKTAIPFPGGKEPEGLPPVFPHALEERDVPNVRKTEPSSTDVIVTDEIIYAFGMNLETGFIDDAFATFSYYIGSERFSGRINRITGVLEATWVKYGKSGWLYLEIKYSLNCRKMERKF